MYRRTVRHLRSESIGFERPSWRCASVDIAPDWITCIRLFCGGRCSTLRAGGSTAAQRAIDGTSFPSGGAVAAAAAFALYLTPNVWPLPAVQSQQSQRLS